VTLLYTALALAAPAAPVATNPIQYVYDQLISTGVVGAVAVLFIVFWVKALRRLDQRDTECAAKIEARDTEIKTLRDQQATREAAIHATYNARMEAHGETYRELTCVVLEALNDNSSSHSEFSEVLRQVLNVLRANEKALDNFLAKEEK